jgi:hypothetical protein
LDRDRTRRRAEHDRAVRRGEHGACGRIQTLGGDDTVVVAADVSELIAPVVDLGADD